MSRFLPRLFISMTMIPFQRRSMNPSWSPSFFTLCSKLATLRCEIPKTLKNSIRNGFESASSLQASAHSFENVTARSFISFQLKAILMNYSKSLTILTLRITLSYNKFIEYYSIKMAANRKIYSHFVVELRGVEPRSKRGSNTFSTCLSKIWFSNEDWIKATDHHLISFISPTFRSLQPTISDTTAPPDRAASDQQHPGNVPLQHLMPD